MWAGGGAPRPGLAIIRKSALSSRGLGRSPLKAKTRVRIPLALPSHFLSFQLVGRSMRLKSDPEGFRSRLRFSGRGFANVAAWSGLTTSPSARPKYCSPWGPLQRAGARHADAKERRMRTRARAPIGGNRAQEFAQNGFRVTYFSMIGDKYGIAAVVISIKKPSVDCAAAAAAPVEAIDDVRSETVGQ